MKNPDFFKVVIFFQKKKCEIFFLKIVFLHDEKIFSVRIFFSDQVCISSNPRNHLEPPPCPHDDSQPPSRTLFSAKITRFSFHNYTVWHCTHLGIVISLCQNLGRLSSIGPSSELKRSRMTKRLLGVSNCDACSTFSRFLEL